MATDKTAILIIGGGWHTPDSYGKLAKALEAAGHDVHCPRHITMNGARPPTASLAEDSGNMRAYAERLVGEGGGRRVVAVMHSYGGQVGTDSLYGLGARERSSKGLKGGVSDLVYFCASALPLGDSMITKVKEMGHEELMPIAFDFADDMTVVCRDPRLQLIGDGVDDKDAEEYLATLVRWNGQAMYDPNSHCAWKEIPVAYVYTTNDAILPLTYQKSMVEVLEKEGIAVKTYELEMGHCPNLTATEGLVHIINKVVDSK